MVTSTQSGESHLAIILVTPYQYRGEPYFLILSMSEIEQITSDQEASLMFMGGFDDSRIAGDYSRDTSFLMCIYPNSGNFSELARRFESIDR